MLNPDCRDFAANVGIDFKTPEEYFLDEAPQPYVRTFDPLAYIKTNPIESINKTPRSPEITPESNASSIVYRKINAVDIVLLCGSPGAGKSTFYWNKLMPLGYSRVNQDTLKSVCLSIL